MAKLRKILTTTQGNRRVDVYRDSEWNEYRCVLCVEGKRIDTATYHTDDRQDAIATAAHMATNP